MSEDLDKVLRRLADIIDTSNQHFDRWMTARGYNEPIIADPLPKDGESGKRPEDQSHGDWLRAEWQKLIDRDDDIPTVYIWGLEEAVKYTRAIEGITAQNPVSARTCYECDTPLIGPYCPKCDPRSPRIADLERERDEAIAKRAGDIVDRRRAEASAARLRKAVEVALQFFRRQPDGETHYVEAEATLTAALQPEPEPSLHWTTDGRSWQAIPHAGLVYNISVASFHHDPSYALKIEANGESIRTLYDSVNDAQAGAQSDYARRAANHVAAALQPEPARGEDSPVSAPGEPVVIGYTNRRGEYAERRIHPMSVWFGASKWHPEQQWFLGALDYDKGEHRDFALKDIGRSPRIEALLKDESRGEG